MIEYFKKLYSNGFSSYCDVLSKDLKNENKRFIVTVNPESIMNTYKDDIVKKIMEDNFSYVPDGIAILKAARKCGIKINERITGIDIAEFLLEEANKYGYSIYLLGAKKEVINCLVDKIKKDYQNINILGYKDGYVSNKDKIMEEIVNLKPDICMVALGIPSQEKLIYKYFNKVNKGIFIGVGGSFDVLSGSKKRAPKIFIKLNLEWLYRIVKEPKRLKRFINNNILFLWKVRRDLNK